MAWDDLEKELWQRALDEMPEGVAERVSNDPFAELFYHEAMWNFDMAGDTRADAYQGFVDYMDTYFNVEWEEVFDWDDWRRAYDQAS